MILPLKPRCTYVERVICLVFVTSFALFLHLAEGEEENSETQTDIGKGEKHFVQQSLRLADECRSELAGNSRIKWNDVYAALETFVREYELRHGVTVVDHELDKKVCQFEGSYFTSGLLKVSFTYVEKDELVSSSVLLKIPQLGLMYEHAVEVLYYSKERYMYEQVIPLLYDNERVSYEKPAPNFYASTDSGILVLENLREAGYEGKVKGTLLDFHACSAVWKTLAQFHALSTLHLDRISEPINSLTAMDRSGDEWSVQIFPALMLKLKNLVLPRCSESVRKLFEDTWENAASATNSGFYPQDDESGVNVLLHGDVHLGNVLLRVDGENDAELTKVKFVDFQESRLGSPIIDLMYFAVTSVHYEVFDEHRDELFRIYVREFRSTLEDLHVPVSKNTSYTLERMNADLRRYRLFFFLQLCGLVPSFWEGGVDVGAGDEETAIDDVLKSEKYFSAFNGWAEHLMRE